MSVPDSILLFLLSSFHWETLIFTRPAVMSEVFVKVLEKDPAQMLSRVPTFTNI